MDRGQEVRELKLGASFTNPNARTVYHTLKYDFKPASVDVHKEATLQTGSNNTVTVTLPHLEGSGVPNTVFKGNQRDYTKKECVLIFNRDTNEIILERLNSQIIVKKTRPDNSSKQPPSTSSSTNSNNSTNASSAAGKGENLTTRHSSKTRVSTGVRKNNILNFVPKHSPLQGSPSYPHRSPQQAPLWNANNTQQTLPSIPSLLDDSFANNSQPPSSVYNNKSNNINASNNLSTLSASTSMPKASGAIMQQQPLQQQHQSQMAVDDIGELSSSSSSDSNEDDSDSDSDSADSTNNHAMNNNISNNNNNAMLTNNNNNNSNSNHHKKAPIVSSMVNNHMDNSAAILRKDLCLSDSNSDSDY